MSKPQEDTNWEELVRLLNFSDLAKAFRDGNQKWHENEWKQFIATIKHQARREVLEEAKKLRPNDNNQVQQGMNLMLDKLEALVEDLNNE